VLLLLLRSGSMVNADTQSPLPYLNIDLGKIGYHALPESAPRDEEIFSNPSLLYDDSITRLAFGPNRVLALYFSRPFSKSPATKTTTRNMEAFFINTDSGSLIMRKRWTTRHRRWLNDLWDTEARIFAVQDGFLVQANANLVRYSANLAELNRFALEHDATNTSWSVTIPPAGRTIHIQRILNQKDAQGSWLNADTLATVAEQQEFPGVSSASSDAVVGRLIQCYGLQVLGKPRKEVCPKPCEFGSPTFLSEKEILTVFFAGFQVLSVDGSPEWNIGPRDAKNCGPRRRILIGNHKRSLDGSRFAISIEAYERTSFDGIDLPQHQFTILVYDLATRRRVLRTTIARAPKHLNELDFDLSPNGDVLAVIFDNTLRVYKITD
jgi:hypothetical protein